MVESKFRKTVRKTFFYLVLLIVTTLCIIPFITIISASFSNESELILKGYGLFPRGFDMTAYKMVFTDPGQLFGAYIVTIVLTAVGAVGSTLIMAMAAYPLSRKNYRWRGFFNMFFYITMLFSGGAVASYIVICQTLDLRDTFWSLVLPCLVSVWNIFLLRTYFQQVPYSLIEAAQIDGASEMYIFFRIIVPLSVVGIVTIFVMMALSFWNQWYGSMMYMTDDKYMTLQYYMYRILSNVDEMLKNENALMMVNGGQLPKETSRMALCVLAAGPMVFVFMFFQKYFSRGLVMGSVKG